jgi:peptide/nickel transport system ATP-binding protein
VVVGETGSGKSLVAQALFGLLPPSLRATGQIRIDGGTAFDIADRRKLRRFWGEKLFFVPQEPRLALDPTMRIDRQIVEGSAQADPEPSMKTVDLPREAGAYVPHMLSGGMAQRALFACALNQKASVIVADEPTKALDDERARQVVDALDGLSQQRRALLVITHDLGVVRRLPGQLIVLREGIVVERGATRAVLASPCHAYTREWLSADPTRWPRRHSPIDPERPVVSARDISFGFNSRTPLSCGIDLDIGRSEIVGLKGPSGSGKTTFGNVLLGLHRPTTGTLHWHGQPILRNPQNIKRLRQRYQKLHQDPASAFVPHRRLSEQLSDLRKVLPGWRKDTLLALLDRMKLHVRLLERRPHEISGGEAQRFAIARVLMLAPDFIVADEPTSRLDPIVQRDVLNLLRDASEESGFGILLIGHDGAVLNAMSDRIANIVWNG